MNRKNLFLLIISIVAISVAAILVKLTSAPATVISMYRMYLACLLLLPFVWLHRSDLKKLSFLQWLYLAIAGSFLGMHFGLWFQSLKYTSVTSSTIILSLQPIVALVGGFIVYKERTNLKTVGTIVLSIIGVVIVSSTDLGTNNSTALIGDLMAFVSVIALVTYLLIGQAKVKGISFWVYSFIVFLFAGIALNGFNLIAKVPLVGYSRFDWLMFLSLAIFPTVAHVIYNYLLNYVNTTTISISTLGEPVGATILAVILLGERITLIQVLGGIIVIIGVFLFLKQQNSQSELAE